MESQEFFTPEMIAGFVSGGMVAVALLLARGIGWVKAFIMGTPTKLDDKVYNAFVKAIGDAGVIPADQVAARSVDNPKPGGVKLQ